MTSRIGKFKISDDETKFSISYRFTFSDFTGSILYLLMLFLGGLILFSYYKTFTIDRLYSISDWLLGLFGLFIFSFGAYLLAAGLYNPSSGIFRVDKIKQEAKLVDFLKSETIPINNIISIFHEIRTSYKPRMKYAMLCMRLRNGDKKECFIVRSSIPFDFGSKVDKDLNIVSRQLRDAINKAIKPNDEREKNYR